MLDAFRHNEKLAWTERHGAVAQLNIELPLQDKEEVVRLVVLVPDKRTEQLDHHHVKVVERGDRSWREVLAEGLQLRREIDAGLTLLGSNRTSSIRLTHERSDQVRKSREKSIVVQLKRRCAQGPGGTPEIDDATHQRHRQD
jgi:hypothetical protein